MADHDSFDPWESTDYFDAEDYASVHNDGTPSNDFSWGSGDSMWNTGSGQAPQGLLGGFDSVGNYSGNTGNTGNTPSLFGDQGQGHPLFGNAFPLFNLIGGLLDPPKEKATDFKNTAIPGTTPIQVDPVDFKNNLVKYERLKDSGRLYNTGPNSAQGTGFSAGRWDPYKEASEAQASTAPPEGTNMALWSQGAKLLPAAWKGIQNYYQKGDKGVLGENLLKDSTPVIRQLNPLMRNPAGTGKHRLQNEGTINRQIDRNLFRVGDLDQKVADSIQYASLAPGLINGGFVEINGKLYNRNEIASDATDPSLLNLSPEFSGGYPDPIGPLMEDGRFQLDPFEQLKADLDFKPSPMFDYKNTNKLAEDYKSKENDPIGSSTPNWGILQGGWVPTVTTGISNLDNAAYNFVTGAYETATNPEARKAAYESASEFVSGVAEKVDLVPDILKNELSESKKEGRVKTVDSALAEVERIFSTVENFQRFASENPLGGLGAPYVAAKIIGKTIGKTSSVLKDNLGEKLTGKIENQLDNITGKHNIVPDDVNNKLQLFSPKKDRANFYSPTSDTVGNMNFGRKGTKLGSQLYKESSNMVKKGKDKGKIVKSSQGDIVAASAITAQEMKEIGVAKHFLDNPNVLFTKQEVIDLVESKRWKFSTRDYTDVGTPLTMSPAFLETFDTKKGWLNVNSQDTWDKLAIGKGYGFNLGPQEMAEAAAEGVIIKTSFTPGVGQGVYTIYHHQGITHARPYVVRGTDGSLQTSSKANIQNVIMEMDRNLPEGEGLLQTKHAQWAPRGTELNKYGERITDFQTKQQSDLFPMNYTYERGGAGHFGQVPAFQRYNITEDLSGVKVKNIHEYQNDLNQSQKKARAELAEYDQATGYFKELDAIPEGQRTATQIEQHSNLGSVLKSMDNPMSGITMEMNRATYNQSVASGQVTPLSGSRNQWLGAQIYQSIEGAIDEGLTRITFPTSRTVMDMNNIDYSAITNKKLDLVTPAWMKDFIKTEGDSKKVKDRIAEDDAKRASMGHEGPAKPGEPTGVIPSLYQQGYETLYDKDLPFQLDKIIKKHNLPTGKTKIRYGDEGTGEIIREVPYIDITPELIKEIKNKGKPLYSKKKEKGLLDYA